MEIKEITEAEEIKGLDVNSTDKVYRVGNDYVKIRLLDVTQQVGMPFGSISFHVSGSHVDSKGKAKQRGAGYRITPIVAHTVQSDTPVDLVEHVKQLRVACINTVLRSIKTEESIQSVLNQI